MRIYMYIYIELQVDVIVVRGEKLLRKHILKESGEYTCIQICTYISIYAYVYVYVYRIAS